MQSVYGDKGYFLFWEVSLDPLSVNYFYIEQMSEEKCNSHQNLKENPCAEISSY